MIKSPKVAIIHDYLTQYGGAEKTLEAILEIFPEAPIYTGIYNPKKLPKTITKRNIVSPTNSLFAKFPKYLTFLMPLVFENFDLRKYDLIISDGTAWAKGVLTNPKQLHISYIHTPPRFLYGFSVESTKRFKWYFKPIIPVLDHFLRVWDYTAAQRPDILLTNSQETRKRVQKFYKRETTVIYPPVDINIPKQTKDVMKKPYYVALGRLAAYKNFDLLVNAFNLLGLPLTIIGTGTEEKRLKKTAEENITFVGQTTEAEKFNLLQNALGLINPVEDEDFGIVPLEAMACGTPVLAHKSGGHLETIKKGITGIFFESTDIENLVNSIKLFDAKVKEKTFNPEKIKGFAQKFGKSRFKNEFAALASKAWEKHAGTSRGTHNSK